MAREDNTPSAMLHRLVAHHAMLGVDTAKAVDRNLLVQYFTEAFCFVDGEAYPIFGCLPESRGELKDPDLDRIVSKRIQRTRGEWEKQTSAA